MPLYFFDTPGAKPVIDDVGITFADDEAACQAAREALPAMLGDLLNGGSSERELTLMVRHEGNEAAYAVTLAMSELRLETQYLPTAARPATRNSCAS